MAANVANTKPDGSDHEWVDADGKLGTHAAEGGHIDAAGGQMDAAQLANIHVSDADNKRIRRKTDIALLTCLVWTYFLQCVLTCQKCHLLNAPESARLLHC